MSYIRTLNQNQIGILPVLGLLSMVGNPEVINVRLNPASTAYFQAGQAVKLLTSSTSKEIIVDAVTGATDGPVFGVIKHNSRGNKPVKGQVVEILAGSGGYIWLEAGAAIAVGANVTASVPGVSGTTDPQVTSTTTTGNYVVGQAVTAASAEGELVQVRLNPSKL